MRDRFDQQAVLRDGEDVRADRLSVPARDAGEPVRDVVELHIERRGIEQVEPPPREHPLPDARFLGHQSFSAMAAHSAWRKQPVR